MRKLLLALLLLLLGGNAFSQDAPMDYGELFPADTLTDEEVELYMDAFDWEEEEAVEPWAQALPSWLLTLFFVLLAVLPALVLVYYIYKRDRLHPEPPRQLVKAFLWGVVSAPIAIVFALLIETVFSVVPLPSGRFWTPLSGAFLGAAIPEECAKLLVLWLFLRKRKDFDEHMDGIVYAVCVGMGFAAFENILYVTDFVGQIDFVGLSGVMGMGLSRAFLSVPGHFGFAVLMGYFYSLAHFQGQEYRETYMHLALLLPILAHGLFDFLLMLDTQGSAWHMLLMLAFFGVFFYLQQLGSRSIAMALRSDTAQNIPESGEEPGKDLTEHGEG
ncbi:MAG: PrsW family intramembrane metalloprotease [Bacteroidales bacterium]|nr:PrsW family intramembrane metalloprotease [Bacteroidales bacterium]